MRVPLDRIMLFVQDVQRLTEFYAGALGFSVVEATGPEWAVMRAGSREIALHRVGTNYRTEATDDWIGETNVKPVLTVAGDLPSLRADLLAKGIDSGEIR